ncbi:lectin-like [Diospyros lotus]|uniref:lectin-like n=1 Tax=Diospyros lotus TaxID=55363 RepID=UPI0022510EFD|nr:lectin-like [Diospyros lotus]
MGASSSQDEAQQVTEEPKKSVPHSSSSSGVNSMPNETTEVTRNQDEEPRKRVSEGSAIDSKVGRTTAQVKLPHNYEAIIKDADSPIDKSSPDKLSDQLQAGVFLTQKKKKYWVDRKSNSNCFMLFSRDLSITWSEDYKYWRWYSEKETSDVLVEVAELLNVCWLEIHGNFEARNLSPGVEYEVVFVMMLKDPAYGWEVGVNLRLILPDGSIQQHEENLMEKPRGRWIEIPAGEFRTSPSHDTMGDIQFSLCEYKGGKWKRGLVVKGAAIRPKT